MDKHTLKIVGKGALAAIFLYLFLVGIGLMGTAFKGFGKEFAETLLNTTSNPFVALFIGILATSLVQSSSTTTSIVVGLVASGVITVGNAIPIIMGANIGTTVTNTLVSLAHITRREEFKRAIAGATVHDFFNLICVAIFFPLELATGFLQKMATKLSTTFVDFGGIKFTSPIKMATEPGIHFIKDLFTKSLDLSHNISYVLILILSIIVMYISLFLIVKLMRSLVIKKTEAVLNSVLEKNGFIGILAGLIFTVIDNSATAADDVIVDIQAGDNIEGDTNGDGLICTDDAVGSSVILLAVSSTRWVVLSTTGTWTAQ